MTESQKATEMKQNLAKTGQSQMHEIFLPNRLTLTLCYTPASQMQLTFTAWCRQPTQAERVTWRDAFAIPPETCPTFDYQAGWGLMRLTWGESKSELEQLGLF